MTTNKDLLVQAQTQLHSGNAGVTLQICEIVLDQDPANTTALHLAGLAHKSLGDYTRAISLMRKSVAVPRPELLHLYHFGAALLEMGKPEDARLWFQRFTELSPKDAGGWNNLGLTLLKLGNFSYAVKHLKRATKLNSRSAAYWSNYGVALQATNDIVGGEAAFRKALLLEPGHGDASLSLATLLTKSRRAKEASEVFADLIAREVNLGMALDNFANLELNLGRYETAESMYNRAVALLPDSLPTWSNWLFCLLHCQNATPTSVFQAHRRFAEHFETQLLPVRKKHENFPDPERCLNIGFISADLRSHVVAIFIEPLLKALSGNPRLKLHAYSNHPVEDGVSERLRQNFATWTPVSSVNDEALAAKVRADAIDILVDLSGHTFGNRLLTFARKPAPLQVSWMGYPGTTGLSAMDYYFADAYFLPPGKFDDQFSEKIVQLPASVCFLPHENLPPVNALPALTNGHITFGSFSHMRKVSREVVAVWGRLLRTVPSARMLLAGIPDTESSASLRAWFDEEEIDESRLNFTVTCPIDEYLELHHSVDIHLDTFPYNGGTTTWHAITMGVPSISLAGAISANRAGASILGQVGLGEFVANTHDEYVEVGVHWAGQVLELAKLRAGMRERFAQSAPNQPQLVAHWVEQAFRTMWKGWCAGRAPESFIVERDLPHS